MFILHILLLLLPLFPQQQDQPLPDQQSFIAEFRKTLSRNNVLLRQYTYTENSTEITLDSKGGVKKKETNVYQVVNGEEEWQSYRRHISKNGLPLPAKEIEKHDREEKERIEKEARKRAGWSDAKRQGEKAKDEREEREIADDVFSMYAIDMVRRENIDSVPTILVTFKAKPNSKPKTREGKILQHIAGRAWIAEADHELVKLEGEVVEPISIGAGLLAKLQKGSTLMFELRKINGEIWLPVRVDVYLNGRLLLLKGVNMREIAEYSDHKKFAVDTILNFGDAVP